MAKDPLFVARDKTFCTTENRFIIPAPFAGKTLKIATFTLGGKRLYSVITRDRSIKLSPDKSHGVLVSIVKITEVQ